MFNDIVQPKIILYYHTFSSNDANFLSKPIINYYN